MKLILQYFSHKKNQNNLSALQQKILEANPILESFGNAKTIRNNNSSRFGKFMVISFDYSLNMQGTSIVSYLLEKSRVVKLGAKERNFHIFYEMMAGLSEEEKTELALNKSHYSLLGTEKQVQGINDEENFDRLIDSFNCVGLSDKQQNEIFKILASILHLGEVQFSGNSDSSSIDNPDLLASISNTFQVDVSILSQALVTRTITVTGQNIKKNLNPTQAKDGRDSLCKLIYDQLFIWIVSVINRQITYSGKNTKGTVGLLDIFGFEVFEENLFNQLLINYCNEKLNELVIF